MTQPLRPIPAEPATTDDFTVGEPTPIISPSLDTPTPEAVDTDGSNEEAPLPTSATAPHPLDQPLYVGSATKGFTVLTYVRDVTAEEILLHVMVTAAGEQRVNLAALGVTLLAPQAVEVPLELPDLYLQPGTLWEADVPIAAAGSQNFTPGTALMRYTFERQPDLYAYV